MNITDRVNRTPAFSGEKQRQTSQKVTEEKVTEEKVAEEKVELTIASPLLSSSKEQRDILKATLPDSDTR
ncbi:hypothetical protein OAE79_00525 [Rhodopirellula sp.]|nr:hypothetical protein [Rhodopirellula sp.]MDB4678795.1 hypothetical protein [Rhodopirellula sp.]